MHLTHYEQDNVYVVSLQGDLTSSSVFTCNQYLEPILENMKRKNGIILDLKGVSTIDSLGVGFICGKLARLKRQKKKLVLCHVSSSLHEVFVLTRLDSLLTFYSTSMEALHFLGDQPKKKAPKIFDTPRQKEEPKNFIQLAQKKY